MTRGGLGGPLRWRERTPEKDPVSPGLDWRRKWQPTPVFLPGESQGQRSLAGCYLWGRTESDTTEASKFREGKELICSKSHGAG